MTQAELARALSVNHATVSRWESGLRRPAHGLVPAVASVLAVSSDEVEEWFEPLPVLGGDTVGRLPGLKRLLHEHHIDVDTAADLCRICPVDLAGWVFGRRSLPRFMVPRLARMLGMGETEFMQVARSSSRTRKGSFLRELRRHRGLTQAGLGVRIGRSEAAIHGWEVHRTIPSAVSIRRLARVLEIDDADLCERMSWPSPPQVMASPVTLAAHDLIRCRRLEEGLSRAELARCVGVTAPTIRRWELGDFRPRPVARRRLAAALELPQLQSPRSSA